MKVIHCIFWQNKVVDVSCLRKVNASGCQICRHKKITSSLSQFLCSHEGYITQGGYFNTDVSQDLKGHYRRNYLATTTVMTQLNEIFSSKNGCSIRHIRYVPYICRKTKPVLNHISFKGLYCSNWFQTEEEIKKKLVPNCLPPSCNATILACNCMHQTKPSQKYNVKTLQVAMAASDSIGYKDDL